jgi:hypothetical protein
MIKTKTYHIKLYINSAEIKEIESGKIIHKTSSVPFSSSRMLLAYFEEAEQFLSI